MAAIVLRVKYRQHPQNSSLGEFLSINEENITQKPPADFPLSYWSEFYLVPMLKSITGKRKMTTMTGLGQLQFTSRAEERFFCEASNTLIPPSLEFY